MGQFSIYFSQQYNVDNAGDNDDNFDVTDKIMSDVYNEDMSDVHENLSDVYDGVSDVYEDMNDAHDDVRDVYD